MSCLDFPKLLLESYKKQALLLFAQKRAKAAVPTATAVVKTRLEAPFGSFGSGVGGCGMVVGAGSTSSPSWTNDISVAGSYSNTQLDLIFNVLGSTYLIESLKTDGE